MPTFPHLSLIIILGYFSLHGLTFWSSFQQATFLDLVVTRTFPFEEFYNFLSFLFYFPSLALQFHAYSIICASHFTRFLLASVSFIIFFLNPIWIFLVSHLNHSFIDILVDNMLLSCFFFFWLHWIFVAARGLSLVVVSGGYSLLWCAGFSLRWLLLLRSTGSRSTGFSSCGMWPQ